MSGFPLTPDGIWCQILRRPQRQTPLRPALFLDRDGVVVEEAHYLHNPEDVSLIDGAAKAIRVANLRGCPVVIVTNQSGIGRGYFGWPEFAATQTRIIEDLAACRAFVDAVFVCPHHEQGRPPYDCPDHPARKPNPGMLTMAAERLPIDLAASWMVGDHATDIGAARAAGLQGAVHVATGHGTDPGQRERALAYAVPGFAVLERASLREAIVEIPFLGDAEAVPTA